MRPAFLLVLCLLLPTLVGCASDTPSESPPPSTSEPAASAPPTPSPAYVNQTQTLVRQLGHANQLAAQALDSDLSDKSSRQAALSNVHEANESTQAAQGLLANLTPPEPLQSIHRSLQAAVELQQRALQDGVSCLRAEDGSRCSQPSAFLSQVRGRVHETQADIAEFARRTFGPFECSENSRLASQANLTGPRGRPSESQAKLQVLAPALPPQQSVTAYVEVQNADAQPMTVEVPLIQQVVTTTPPTLNLEPHTTAFARLELEASDTANTSRPAAFTVPLDLRGEDRRQRIQLETELDQLPPGALDVCVFESQLRVQPGERVAVPFLVSESVDTMDSLAVQGPSLVRHSPYQVSSEGTTGGFAMLQAPRESLGSVLIPLSFSLGDATDWVYLQLEAAPEDTRKPAGPTEVIFTARTVDNKVLKTTHPGIAFGTFEKAEKFSSLNLSHNPVTVGPDDTGLRSGVYQAASNLTTGEARTVRVEPADLVPPVRVQTNVSATTELDRANSVDRFLRNIPLEQLPPAFENASEGDTVAFRTTAGDIPVTFRFRVIERTEETMDLRRLAEEGETTTFYSPWPNATEVVKVNRSTIVYQTTPPPHDGPFAWTAQTGTHVSHWGKTTTVAEVTAERILLRHDPEVGHTYEFESERAEGEVGLVYQVDRVTSDQAWVSGRAPVELDRPVFVDVSVLGRTSDGGNAPSSSSDGDGPSSSTAGGLELTIVSEEGRNRPSSYDWCPEGDPDFVWEGTVENTGNERAYLDQVIIELYDKNGDNFDGTWKQVETYLQPGERLDVRLVYECSEPTVEGYEGCLNYAKSQSQSEDEIGC